MLVTYFEGAAKTRTINKTCTNPLLMVCAVLAKRAIETTEKPFQFPALDNMFWTIDQAVLLLHNISE